MSYYLASLRRSSSSPFTATTPSTIHRLTLRPFFNQPESQCLQSTIRACSSSSFGQDMKNKIGGDSDFGFLFKSFAGGFLLASALAFSFYSSSYCKPNIAFADSSTPAPLTQDHSKLHSTADNHKTQRYLFADSFRKKVFFNYEKRLRLRGPPEKVFEYFASFRNPDGEVFMTPADLMRAVVPVFPPSESNLVREGYLRGERGPGELRCTPSKFFLLFDTNNDGLISFAEYIFFVTLLSIPESSFAVAFRMFDLDNSGEIDREEFKKVMALMRAHNRHGVHQRDGLRIGLKARNSVENGGLLEYFFGKDGKSYLRHENFIKFLRELHNEIVYLEFAHYDYKLRGSISAKDFALSMIASADLNHTSKFLDRVDEIDKEPHLRDARITSEEFKAFAELRRQLQPLSLAIFSYGKVNGSLTRNDFQRAASHVCGVSLTDNLVNLIFHVFDVNGDGNLSTNEFIRVLQRREKDIARPEAESGLTGLVSCWFNCAKSCSFEEVLF